MKFKIQIIFNLPGIFFRIAYYPNGCLLLSIASLASLVFIILGVIDVFMDDNCKPVEKLMWTLGYIVLSWIAGLLYYPKFKMRN